MIALSAPTTCSESPRQQNGPGIAQPRRVWLVGFTAYAHEGWGQTQQWIKTLYLQAGIIFTCAPNSQQRLCTPFCNKLRVNVRPLVGRWRWGEARGFKEHTHHVSFAAFKGERSRQQGKEGGRAQVAPATAPKGRL